MLANGVKETTVTTGTGTITLAAVTGFTRFSAAFAVGDRVAYCIKDGDNREWGVGTVAAGNTLERTLRLGTLVAGTYSADSEGALTAITLASASSEVVCDVHDLILPELGSEYLQVPANPKRFASLSNGVNIHRYTVPSGFGNAGIISVGWSLLGTGVATARNMATTNLFTSATRMGYVSDAVAGASAGIRATLGICHRGSGDKRGGFLLSARFGISDTVLVSDARLFIGMNSAGTALTNADQSTINNVVGLNLGTADANLNILTRGTVATQVDLGASFSRANVGNNANLITFTLWAPPSAAFIGYRVTMEGTAPAEATGYLTTNLPDSDTLLMPHIWRNTGATAASVGIDIAGISIRVPQ